MSLIVARFRHHVKVLVGNQLERFLSKQYWRGKGPAARLISIFSEQAKTIGVKHNILVAPIPLKKLAPNYSLEIIKLRPTIDVNFSLVRKSLTEPELFRLKTSAFRSPAECIKLTTTS